jgi:hypothetical protein
VALVLAAVVVLVAGLIIHLEVVAVVGLVCLAKAHLEQAEQQHM